MQNTTWDTSDPYGHPCIAAVISQTLFGGRNAIAKDALWEKRFKSISENPKELEVPAPLVAFAATAVSL